MRLRLLKLAGGLLGLAVVVYLGDLIILRVREAAHGQAFGTVTVHRFYRIAQKNGKSDIQYDGDYNYDCVHAVFPHAGDQPCWYRSRHTEEWIDIKSGAANNPHIF